MRLALTVLFGLMFSGPLRAQDQIAVPGSEWDDYLRLVELIDRSSDAPLIYRSPSSLRHLSTGDQAPWSARYRLSGVSPRSNRLTIRWLTPRADLDFNSTYPAGGNDGALWAGRGLSGSFLAGAEGRWGPLTATLYPALLYAQNRAFPLAPVTDSTRSSFGYPWDPGIDLPQRFGSAALRVLDWGQSGLRLDLGRFTAGLTTENLWFGPSFRNAIIMSTAGPGFPHLDVGTGRPVRLGKAGTLEVRVVAGALAESEYFDSDPTNTWRFLNGLTLGFAPGFVPGLTVGFTRVLYNRWSDGRNPFLVLGGLFNKGTVNASGVVVNDSTDQLLSLTMRWLLPASGFGVHVEWARNDFSGDLRDFLLEPDASDALTIGVQQALPGTGAARWRIRAEATRLGPSATSRFRGSPPFYLHQQLTQGYTNRGQMVGAAIGPGGDSQFLGLDRYHPNGRWGVFLERVRLADDSYFARFANQSFQYLYHDVELTAGASAVRFLGSWQAEMNLAVSRRLNRYFVLNDDVTNLKVAWAVTRTR